MRILWLSRHPPIPAQLAELRRLFGEFELVKSVSPYKHADEVAERIRKERISETVFVGPTSVLQRLCEMGIRPLRAVMVPAKESEKCGLEYDGHRMNFLKFVRVIEVKIVTEEIEPKPKKETNEH